MVCPHQVFYPDTGKASCMIWSQVLTFLLAKFPFDCDAGENQSMLVEQKGNNTKKEE
jgi:hypothetical protein